MLQLAEITAASIGHNQPPALPRFKRVCTECGTDFRSAMRHADFCCDAHRKAWNNRRLTRGAELYDLVMVLRHERGVARASKVWNLVCRLASEYRAEDERERAGRKSWRGVNAVLERRPYLRNVTTNISIKRRGH